MENHVISSLQGPKKTKNIFLGLFGLSEGYTCLIPSIVIQALSTVSDSQDMNLGNTRTFGPYFDPINWFRPPFSLIAKSILKIDPL